MLKFTGKERLLFGSDMPWTPLGVTKGLVGRIERDLSACVGSEALGLIWEDYTRGLF